MQLQLPRAHRLARVNYLIRSGSFAYSFVIILALFTERGFSASTLTLAVVTLLAYPQLAYLHARLAVDSKRAELRNLGVDSVLMGIWAAQLHFALWPVCGALVGVSLNNAVCGGVGRFVSGTLIFCAAALVWAMLGGSPFQPDTGPLVTILCFVGIIGYASVLAIHTYGQNKRLVSTRNVLRTSEEQFRFIAERAGDLVAVLTPEHRLRYASPSHGQYFEPGRYSEGSDWTTLIHPDDRQRAGGFLDLLRESAHGQRIRLRMVPVKGSTRLIECDGNPVRDEGGNFQMIVLVCRDLTARANDEMDLSLAGRAFDRLADAVLVSDDSGRVEFVNKAYLELMSHAAEKAVGRPTNDLRIGIEPGSRFEEIGRSVAQSGFWYGKFSDRRKDGELRALTAQVTAVHDTQGVAPRYVWIISEESAAAERNPS